MSTCHMTFKNICKSFRLYEHVAQIHLSTCHTAIEIVCLLHFTAIHLSTVLYNCYVKYMYWISCESRQIYANIYNISKKKKKTWTELQNAYGG